MKLNRLRTWWRRHIRVILAAAALMPACTGLPTKPTTVTEHGAPYAPNPGNAAPVISSLTAAAPNVEADEEIQLAAQVSDAETPGDQLMYEWSVNPANGRFVGSGRQVSWRAPWRQSTPEMYTFTLTVIEKYTIEGQLRENRTSATVPVRYNDGHLENANIALDFLRDFTNASASPEQAVRNFSDRCVGKSQQLEAVRSNRQGYQAAGGEFTVDLTSLNDNRTWGEIFTSCTFRNVSKATGKTEVTAGTCVLTSVYENYRWLLCGSRFVGSPGTTAAPNTHP